MLRSKRICGPGRACRHPGLAGAALLLALGMGGCSADLARFDFPAGAGYAPQSSTGAVAPVPSEPVRRNNAGIPVDRDWQYDRGPSGRYDAPPPDRYGSAAPPPGRYEPQPVERYDQGRGKAVYGDASRGGYAAPPASGYDSRHDARPQQNDRVASLPPPGRDYASPAPSRPEPVARRPEPYRPQARPDPQPRAPVPAERPRDARASTPAPANAIVVQSGETLSSIARRHRVSVSELMAHNHLSNPNLRPGQQIAIPRGKRAIARRPVAPAYQPEPERRQAPAEAVAEAPPVSVQPSESGRSQWRGSYTVAQGDSLYGIARKHNVKVAELAEANGISDPTKVRAGTELKVPAIGGSDGRVQPASEPLRMARAETPQPTLAQGRSEVSPITVRPTIINAEKDEAEPKRVAALGPVGRTATDATRDAAPKAEKAALPQVPRLGGTGKFRWPVKGKIIAGFGARSDKSHNDGVNIAVPQGAEVLAAESGVVAYAGNELKGYGNLILVRHENNWVSAYAHNDELLVRRGDTVTRGQAIAKAGNTGSVDRPQLHFELRQDSRPVDPIPHMEKP